MDLRVRDDPARAVAEMLVEAAGGGRHIVLTGGSTPAKAYAMAADADWSRATAWFGDERCVDPDDERSNYGMTRKTLLDSLRQEPDVVRMRGELGPEEGAREYEAQIRDRLGDEPRFDLLLLGLGPDGHCASLFPNRPEKEVRDRLVVGVPEAGMEPYVPRISLTLPCLNAARRVVFLVTGSGKAEAMRRAFGDPPDHALPAAHVRPPAGELVVVCDAAAAGELTR
jgi:6-phosphogluconolactonase